MIIGCDLHTRYQQIAMLDTETGELVERRWSTRTERHELFMQGLWVRCEWGSKPLGTRTGSRPCWRSWDTNCGWEMRPRFARRWYASRRRMRGTRRICWKCCAAIAFRRSGGRRWGAGSAATGLAPAEVGVDAGSGEESNARAGHGRGCVSEEEVVHGERAQGIGGADAGPWASYRRQELLRMFDELAGVGRRTGCGGGVSREESAAGGASDDASGSGTSDVASFRADHRAGRTFRTQQASGELSGTESAGAQFGRKAAAGIDQQARQPDDAVVVGGSGSHGGALRSRN